MVITNANVKGWKSTWSKQEKGWTTFKPSLFKSQGERMSKSAVLPTELMIVPSKVLSFVQLSPLIDGVDMQEIGFESDWATPIASYLKDGTLPDGKKAARKLKVQAAWFVLIKNVLYKRGFSRPYLRCLSPEEADYVIRKVYEGICRNHSRTWSLVHKLVWAGYYWSTMQKVAKHMSKPATSVKGLVTLSDNQQKSSPQWWPRGLLLNKGWTSWAHSK